MTWDFPADHFETIFALDVIENVASIPAIHECEVHRIEKDGSTVHEVTPHISYIDAYSDPTHRWHLSSEWYTTNDRLLFASISFTGYSP